MIVRRGIPEGGSVLARSDIVETSQGRVRGLRRNGALVFLGLPYAAPTGGGGRFRAPRPALPWSGVRDAISHGERCVQDEAGFPAPFGWYDQGGRASENCCVLNIHAPQGAQGGPPRPVMVYIHGGGFTCGGSNNPLLEGDRLALAGDIVVVTLNHRINIFGYLDIGALDGGRFADAGNLGQLDLIAALRWVRDNIAAFGGDAGNVTLVGQSGGGSKIMALLSMPAAAGLFHRALAMSGGSMWGQAPTPEWTRAIRLFLDRLGLGPDNLAALSHLPARELLRARAGARAETGFEFCRPVVDGRHLPDAVFAPGAGARPLPVPLLLGTTETEATFYYRPDSGLFRLDEAGLLDRIARQFSLDRAGAERIVAGYREDDPAARPSDILIQIGSDIRFRGPIIKAAEHIAATGAAPAHLYTFAWRSALDGGRWGAPHACDLPFLFGTLDAAAPLVTRTPQTEAVSRAMMAVLFAFMRSSGRGPLLHGDWAPYDAAQRRSLTIGPALNVVSDMRAGGRRTSRALLGPEGPRLAQGPLFSE